MVIMPILRDNLYNNKTGTCLEVNHPGTFSYRSGGEDNEFQIVLNPELEGGSEG